ncbi:MAG: hypothetical protein II198_06525 [Bacteroidaceae bacterium]|nr:hypothetical protein [Bacteroidaceae bacterium]
MGKNIHGQLIEEKKPTLFAQLADRLNGLPSFLGGNLFAVFFFVAVWALLAFCESALLFRVNELSVFLYDDLFYEEMMSLPAGILYYVASWLVQFFYYPVLGATIYVALLAMVYWLTYRVFGIPSRFRLLAMLPVVALLASNTQLGYWIYYIKIPGYYYVALLGVLVSLLAIWAVKRAHIYLKPLLIVAWVYFAFPCIGVYAIASGVVMGLHALCRAIGGRRGAVPVVVSSVTLLVAAVAAYVVPPLYYQRYTTVPLEEIYRVGVPSSQWKSEYVPDNEVKLNEASIIKDINGRVGYPVSRVLTKFRLNIDGSFSQKALNTAKSELLSSTDINRPVDGKKYTFTFVEKDGDEYYLYDAGDRLALARLEKGTAIPGSGHFTCVGDGKIKEMASFKAQSGKYLVWNRQQDTDGERWVPALAASPSEGYSRCTVVKMDKTDKVQAADDLALFGVVNLLIFDNVYKVSDGISPLCVVGMSNGELASSPAAMLNDVHTSAMRIDEVGFTPKPFALEMQERSMWYNVLVYWVPFFLLMFSFVLLAMFAAFEPLCGGCRPGLLQPVLWLVGALLLAGFTSVFWYRNVNFRVENQQNRAMWNEEWSEVARLARKTDVPTRQVVMNKNLALLKLGVSGNEMFGYPEGSADIEASIPVRLAQTGGKMAYFQYGKFNFCYRWCVEDAVEYGWRIEYLKHAVRSMILSGEYRLAQRYIDILKKTTFYADWAASMEKYVQNPEEITRNREFLMPLNMTCYDDYLDVDESYVEAYLTKNLTNATEKMSRVYVESALVSALTRKDSKSFWFFLNYYVNELKASALPKHYQEAVLLFLNLDKGRTVQVPKGFIDKFISVGTNTRLNKFMQLVSQHKGKSEEEMAPYFKDDFGDSYFYFYFFVRNIKTN